MKDSIQTSLPITEKSLQSFCDDYLTVKRFSYFRIPDAFFHWIAANCPVRIKQWFFSLFGGLPDTTVFFPLNERYTLAVAIELKRKGSYLRENQKQASSALPWIVARSPEQIIEIVDEAEQTAARLREILMRKNGFVVEM